MQFAIDDGPKRLDESFVKKGILYKKEVEGNSYFIYSARLKDGSREWFEVFQKRINKPYTISGVEIGASEAWPSSEAFGSWAWTFQSLNAAIVKAQSIKVHSSIDSNSTQQ